MSPRGDIIRRIEIVRPLKYKRTSGISSINDHIDTILFFRGLVLDEYPIPFSYSHSIQGQSTV